MAASSSHGLSFRDSRAASQTQEESLGQVNCELLCKLNPSPSPHCSLLFSRCRSLSRDAHLIGVLTAHPSVMLRLREGGQEKLASQRQMSCTRGLATLVLILAEVSSRSGRGWRRKDARGGLDGTLILQYQYQA